MGEVTEGSFNLCKAQAAEPWLGEGWEVWRWGGESNTTYGGASSKTHCHTAGPPPRAETSLHPGARPPARGCLSGGPPGGDKS